MTAVGTVVALQQKQIYLRLLRLPLSPKRRARAQNSIPKCN